MTVEIFPTGLEARSARPVAAARVVRAMGFLQPNCRTGPSPYAALVKRSASKVARLVLVEPGDAGDACFRAGRGSDDTAPRPSLE